MNNIKTIVKKEFMDILRDRKTLLMTFLIPIVIMPLLFSFIFSSVSDLSSPSEDNKYKIQLDTNSTTIKEMFASNKTIELVNVKNPEQKAYDGDILMYIKANDVDDTLSKQETPKIDFYYDTTSQRAMTCSEVIQSMFNSYQDSYVASYLQANNLSTNILKPFDYQTHSENNDSDSISLMLLGMMVPMMIIGYSSSGITPIATDLGAGEKERGTLEPLLSTSVSRSSILVSKLIVTGTFGILTSVLSAIGLLLAMKFGMANSIGITINISISNILLILLLAILYIVFISAVMLLVSTYARTVKEANTYLTPVTLVPMLLSVITMYMDANSVSLTMMNIPILNVVMVIKEIILNQLNYTHLYITIGWSVVYIVVSMFIAKKMYEKEEVIFRM